MVDCLLEVISSLDILYALEREEGNPQGSLGGVGESTRSRPMWSSCYFFSLDLVWYLNKGGLPSRTGEYSGRDSGIKEEVMENMAGGG